MGTQQYLLYFSHSWFAEHVDLNIAIWEYLWEKCRFLVDDNAEEVPPYYVSRVEDLVKRSDCLVAFAPPPPVGTTPVQEAPLVSPYVLFEIALAERAQIPRLVIVDERAEIERPPDESPLVRYLQLDLLRLQSSSPAQVWTEVSKWLAAVESTRPPKDEHDTRRAAVLFPASGESADVRAALESSLHADGYAMVSSVSEASGLEALRQLRQADLLVADIGSPAVWDRYGIAHALAVPSILCARRGLPQELPAITGGHQAGFQEDVVGWSTTAELVAEVSARARALRAPRLVIDTLDEGREYFERRRQRPSAAVI